MIDNSLTHFLLTKPKNEELHEYMKRFKSSKQVLESHLGGPIKFTKYVSKMDTYDLADDKKNSGLYLEAQERFSVYKYFKNAKHEDMAMSSGICLNKKGLEKTNYQKQ